LEEAHEALLSTSSNLDYLRQGLASALDLTPAPATPNSRAKDKGSAAKTDAGKVVEAQARPLLQTIREDVLGLMPSPGASAARRGSTIAKLVKDLSASDPVSDTDVVAQARNLAHLRSHSLAAEDGAADAPVQEAVDPQAGGQQGLSQVAAQEKPASDDRAELARSFLRGVKNLRNAAAAHSSKPPPSRGESKASREQGERGADAKGAPPLMLSGRSDPSSGLDLTKGLSGANWLATAVGAFTGSASAQPHAALAETSRSPRRVLFSGEVKKQDDSGEIAVYGLANSEKSGSREDVLAEMRSPRRK